MSVSVKERWLIPCCLKLHACLLWMAIFPHTAHSCRSSYYRLFMVAFCCSCILLLIPNHYYKARQVKTLRSSEPLYLHLWSEVDLLKKIGADNLKKKSIYFHTMDNSSIHSNLDFFRHIWCYSLFRSCTALHFFGMSCSFSWCVAILCQ